MPELILLGRYLRLIGESNGESPAPVISRTVAAQPVSPVDGDRYLLDMVTPTGASWATNAGKWAEFVSIPSLGIAPSWWFFTPVAGIKVYVADVTTYYKYTTAWSVDATGSGGSLPAPIAFTDPAGGAGATMVAGILTITHGLGRAAVTIQVWDQNGKSIGVVQTHINANVESVDLTSLQSDAAYSSGGVLTGTWQYRVL